MGRWSQRRRGRGGGNVGGQVNVITQATLVNLNLATATYFHDIDAAAFIGTEFTSIPSGEVSFNIEQNDPNSLNIQFIGDITGDDTLQYIGTVTNTQSPDTILYT